MPEDYWNFIENVTRKYYSSQFKNGFEFYSNILDEREKEEYISRAKREGYTEIFVGQTAFDGDGKEIKGGLVLLVRKTKPILRTSSQEIQNSDTSRNIHDLWLA